MISTDISVDSISEKYTSVISNFKTYESELKDFLIEEAQLNQDNKISKTFLLFNKGDLVGYISLLCDALRVDGDLKCYLKNENIFYKTLPAIKIGRLAIDDRYQRQGFGTKLLMLAYSYAINISQDYCGCRFLILDAKRNKELEKDSIHFYKKFNFKVLKSREKGTIPMYLDILLNNSL